MYGVNVFVFDKWSMKMYISYMFELVATRDSNNTVHP